MLQNVFNMRLFQMHITRFLGVEVANTYLLQSSCLLFIFISQEFNSTTEDPPIYVDRNIKRFILFSCYFNLGATVATKFTCKYFFFHDIILEG